MNKPGIDKEGTLSFEQSAEMLEIDPKIMIGLRHQPNLCPEAVQLIGDIIVGAASKISDLESRLEQLSRADVTETRELSSVMS